MSQIEVKEEVVIEALKMIFEVQKH